MITLIGTMLSFVGIIGAGMAGGAVFNQVVNWAEDNN